MSFAKSLLCASSGLALGLAAASTASAQASAADAETAVSEVVVTGSRTVSNGTQSPTPLTVTSAEQLRLAAPTVADALNTLPVFKAPSRPQNPGTSANGTAGASLLNLRGLGSQRGLVLLDGRRVVTSNVLGSTDINLLPQDLVQRVEVVTGGASAAYGSDAVAGVVNFILDTKFRGLKGEVQAGTSTYQDSESYRASLTFGQSFGPDDRGSIIASVDYYDVDGLGYGTHDRKWLERQTGQIPNLTGARPLRLIVDNVTYSATAIGGLINAGTLRGTTFGPGGVPRPYQYGATVGSVFMAGGEGWSPGSGLTASINRQTAFGHVDYRVADNLNVYAEGAYAKSKTPFEQFYPYAFGTSQLTIFRDNAYLPAATLAQMTTANLASVTMGRIFTEAPLMVADNTSETKRFSVGFAWDIGGSWKADGYFGHGESNLVVKQRNVINLRNFFASVDAVRNPAGQIVCRSTLTGLDPGCVPLNPFGVGAPSAGVFDYILGTSERDLTLKQTVAAANVRGELFSLWSDPIAVAAGLEYRKESASQETDAISQGRVDFTGLRGGPAGFNGQLGGWIISNPQPISGSFKVREGYVEANVPIVKDMALAKDLSVNAAARLTDYSLSGSVTTWKVGVNYRPFEDLRLRGTRSRDIRAPNINELFSGGVQATNFVRDPATGATVAFTSLSRGNPNLDPETADTYTVGAVYQPQWFHGFDASIDYYNIKIKGAIASLSAQTTVDECFRGSALSCGNIQSVGGQLRIDLPQLNLQSLKTSGFDVEFGYRTDLAGGLLSLRVLANQTQKFETTTPGAPPIDRAGEVGSATQPKWTGVGSVNYTRGPLTLYLQERYIDHGAYNITFVDGVDINDNTIPAVWYTDVSVKYKLEVAGRNLELFANINNLFNKAPPAAPQVSTFIVGSNFSLYDPIGRYYTTGLRFRF